MHTDSLIPVIGIRKEEGLSIQLVQLIPFTMINIFLLLVYLTKNNNFVKSKPTYMHKSIVIKANSLNDSQVSRKLIVLKPKT